ncbi:MAG: cobyric acid synthase CobQ, partial [Hydrogenoanaerobacterium sp.]
RISNATDFNALEYIDGVSLRYVSNIQQLGTPDMIILPGTKNTMEDLLWLRQNGLEAEVKKHAARGGIVFGICGGYQMLGEALYDPLGVEHGGTLVGMGLLPVTTEFAMQKTRTRTSGSVNKISGALEGLSGAEFTGYEIHMGKTVLHGGAVLCSAKMLDDDEKKADGAFCGNVYGSYMHGFFDSEDVASGVVAALYKAKGLKYEPAKAVNLAQYKEQQYDLLADAVREALDMKKIYEILEAGV